MTTAPTPPFVGDTRAMGGLRAKQKPAPRVMIHPQLWAALYHSTLCARLAK